MQVYFRTIGNKQYTLQLHESSTFREARFELSKQCNAAPEQIKLTYKSKQLSDEDKLSEIGYTDGSYIILFIKKAVGARKEVKKPASPKPAVVTVPKPPAHIEHYEKPIEPEFKANTEPGLPSIAPLPSFEDSTVDPPGVQQKVRQLAVLGYGESDCLNALRASAYQVDQAAEYLLQGFIPEKIRYERVPPPPTPSDEEDDEVVFDEEEDGEEPITLDQLRDDFVQHPENLKAFLDQLAIDNPEIASLIKTNPALALANFGFDPNDFDLSAVTPKSKYEEYMSQFTEEERMAIHRLEEKGFDTMTVIQVYVACEKNEELTTSCLNGF